MIIKKNNLAIILFCTILTACGFKPIAMDNINSISMIELDTKGNKIINYKISNYLKQNLGYGKDNPTKIKVEINSNKKRTVKEKNSKNEITKYTLTITSEVIVNNLENSTNFTFSLIKINEYKVDNKYSVTIQNEKKAVDEIINNLTQDIVENILLKI
jgi:hypothetical protein